MEERASPLKPGYALDRYELLCPIASGGMASVWLARMRGKRGFEKLFAIKTIRGELVDDPRFEQMFLDEARIASGIQHPNVAHILDLGEKDGILYLVMEWVDGESLAKVRKIAVKKGVSIPLGITLRVLADACAGLHAAHELKDADGHLMGVVHRDVSPQNLLVATSGAVKVIDFGIAKAENRGAPRTRTGIVKGKMQYMAPEQARGGAELDRRVDVWAIGVCLYELVSGRLPYDGDNPLEIVEQLASGKPPPPIPEASESVQRLLQHTLVHDRDKRFPTAAALRRALENAIVMLDLPATSDEVAAFVEQHMPERAQSRKDLVAQALKEAAERQKVDVYTGTVEVMSGPPAPGQRGTTEGRTPPSGKTRAAVPSAVALLEGNEPSNATLGSAAVSGGHAARPARGGRSVAWLLALLAVGGGAYALRGRIAPLLERVGGAEPPATTASAPAEVDAASLAPSEPLTALTVGEGEAGVPFSVATGADAAAAPASAAASAAASASAPPRFHLRGGTSAQAAGKLPPPPPSAVPTLTPSMPPAPSTEPEAPDPENPY